MFAKNIDGKQGNFKALYFRSDGREYGAFLMMLKSDNYHDI
jgi:hypothetical protein